MDVCMVFLRFSRINSVIFRLNPWIQFFLVVAETAGIIFASNGAQRASKYIKWNQYLIYIIHINALVSKYSVFRLSSCFDHLDIWNDRIHPTLLNFLVLNLRVGNRICSNGGCSTTKHHVSPWIYFFKSPILMQL